MTWLIRNESTSAKPTFKKELSSGKLLRFVGAWSPYIALMVEKIGFDGVYISGAGVAGEPTRSVSFAIGLVPSASQINEEPDLVRSIRFRGIDSFTGDAIDQSITNVNTRLTEEGFNEKYADVEQQ